MTSFPLTAGAHYVRSFNVFIAKSGQKMKNFELLRHHIPQLVQTESLSRCQRSSFNILSVGGGTGDIDMEIMTIIKKELQNSDQGRHMKIFNRAIEPNEYSCSLYRAAIESLPNPVNNDLTEFEICQQTFQEYKDSPKDSQHCEAGSVKFDIVHFIHSIYYIDSKQALMHCIEKELSEQGVLVCLVGGQDFIYWVTSRLNILWHGRDKDIEKYETAEEIIKIAKKNGWKHEIYSQEYSTDLTDVFDEKSTEGNLHLDFLTHTVNFRETADKQLVEETLALLKELTIVKDGKHFGDIKESLIIIYK